MSALERISDHFRARYAGDVAGLAVAMFRAGDRYGRIAAELGTAVADASVEQIIRDVEDELQR